MYVRMIETLSCPLECYRINEIYDVSQPVAELWQLQNFAVPSLAPPPLQVEFVKRLETPNDKPVLFVPFVGEFGHLCQYHLRYVHWHKSPYKIVCCRKGDEVLYPSASEYFTDWIDPIPDIKKIATLRSEEPKWPELSKRFPGVTVLKAGNTTPQEEIECLLAPDEYIDFHPLKRNLKADIVIGVRYRELFKERNWQHYQFLADTLSSMGLSFATMGHKATSFDLKGQTIHTGDLDTNAAVELLQQCKCYVGTDSGTSHLAAAVGCPMIVFREKKSGSRDMTHRMTKINRSKTIVVDDGWQNVASIVRTIGEQIKC